MSEQLLRLRERVDNELRRARVAGGRVPGKALALAAEIEALAATLRKLYGERGLDIICDIDPTIGFKGDREDLLELCGNLLDNACKWARSQVLVTARRGHGIVLHVEDDGPGCSPEDLQKLAQRGVRLDDGVEGHGLGLAIARNIATSYGATLTLGRSAALGGFEVAVRFPAR
jgi:signal transduction histidine kinase